MSWGHGLAERRRIVHEKKTEEMIIPRECKKLSTLISFRLQKLDEEIREMKRPREVLNPMMRSQLNDVFYLGKHQKISLSDAMRYLGSIDAIIRAIEDGPQDLDANPLRALLDTLKKAKRALEAMLGEKLPWEQKEPVVPRVAPKPPAKPRDDDKKLGKLKRLFKEGARHYSIFLL